MTQESLTFSSLNLSNELLKTLEEMKFHTPSAIQAKTIPPLLEGKDVIGLAQTGTGKTAAFALPILQGLSDKIKNTQALILTPTRELAIQVADQIETLSRYQKNSTVAILCGGQDYRRQLKQLRDGAKVVVGTPGRILDHIERGSLQLGQLSTFVLDEADEMLRMGFIEDVETILAQLPEKKQMALFSATMPSRIRHIAQNYLNDPVSIEIQSKTATVKTIEQKFLFASGTQKSAALLRVLAVEDFQGVIVFVKTKSSTEEVAQVLQQQNYRAMAIHGDISQNQREYIITQFRQGTIDILVATDVAARGLDVDRITHVINFDIPFDCETYVHRIGRTGRAGRSGTAVLFVTPKETRMLNMIERHTRQRIEKMFIPDDRQIKTARKKKFMAKITERLQHENIKDYLSLIEEYITVQPTTSAMHVAAALALLANQDESLQEELRLPQVSDPVKDKPRKHKADRSYSEDKPSRSTRRSNRERSSGDPQQDQDLFRIDIGRVHGVKPGNIVGAIANEAGLLGRQISGLKIHADHSTVRLPKGLPKNIVKDLTKAWVCGRQLNLSLIDKA
ncbi:DEAD/DEAH box helicase [Legionella israelensis]|uniref:ATP-dependent RNA helicase DeaD n=1 Tax=Legionella israelensis TaxID=454 RepID=A0A0W0V2C9_9GAMM|nr:DEAD/DEAH box helicase [Legionella israelensis]KTD14276.1 ATP-dependent RNA helicase [Legionella israelensis]QBR84628.1 DEAD/DEAH box helicase [Legionella israelensis]QBS10566.1 DEAD/DEAH box helicase [Legionella israelensis]SCX93693.1 ATP-dependent RNA helicase DeaD [Legionella israelensis DSM 19235]STX57507.1 ATP-dependent RNA helicase DeaD [Legionella israelensis]